MLLGAMPSAESYATCEERRAPSVKRYRQLTLKAVNWFVSASHQLITFDLLPTEFWRHLWTTDVVESRLGVILHCRTVIIMKTLSAAECTLRLNSPRSFRRYRPAHGIGMEKAR
jgi:transposase-like protein